jgi:hypothetical protein
MGLFFKNDHESDWALQNVKYINQKITLPKQGYQTQVITGPTNNCKLQGGPYITVVINRVSILVRINHTINNT